ncbi:hypothetical protein F4861DRAFT_367131 [Xylaria intraflava]|nr:hypothetical protein F4861DRAFT_367131 [Xylaria intraflava]
MRNSYRTPSSDEEWSSDNDSDGIYVNNRRKHMREDSPMELNGTTKMLLDINGVLHYDTTLDPGNPSAASDKIRTKRCRISLMASDLVLVNQDGLHPKLASDLYTFNNGFVEVKESPVAGYGCFAVRDLDPQTPILVERELFCARPYNLAEKLGALTEEQMKAYDSLHWHMNTPSDDIRKAIWRTNHFAVKGGGSVFLVAARFNHACNDRNNVEYSFDFSKRCMAFVTTKKVSAGEELFIRYGSNPVHLLEVWGFRCKCGGCAGVPEDDDKDASPRAGQLHENDDWTA